MLPKAQGEDENSHDSPIRSQPLLPPSTNSTMVEPFSVLQFFLALPCRAGEFLP